MSLSLCAHACVSTRVFCFFSTLFRNFKLLSHINDSLIFSHFHSAALGLLFYCNELIALALLIIDSYMSTTLSIDSTHHNITPFLTPPLPPARACEAFATTLIHAYTFNDSFPTWWPPSRESHKNITLNNVKLGGGFLYYNCR